MTPVYLNSLSNDQYHEHQFLNPSDHQRNEHQFLSPNSQASSSSNSLTCHLFFKHATHDQDGGFEQSNPSQNEDYDFGSQTYNDHHVESQDERHTSNGGLKFPLCKREIYDHMNDENQVKWMSSKMRVMLKMKKTYPTKMNTFRSNSQELIRVEDHQQAYHGDQTSPPMENTSSNINNPIRVCSDCNTTKTPLWRSGPQGPKVYSWNTTFNLAEFADCLRISYRGLEFCFKVLSNYYHTH